MKLSIFDLTAFYSMPLIIAHIYLYSISRFSKERSSCYSHCRDNPNNWQQTCAIDSWLQQVFVLVIALPGLNFNPNTARGQATCAMCNVPDYIWYVYRFIYEYMYTSHYSGCSSVATISLSGRVLPYGKYRFHNDFEEIWYTPLSWWHMCVQQPFSYQPKPCCTQLLSHVTRNNPFSYSLVLKICNSTKKKEEKTEFVFIFYDRNSVPAAVALHASVHPAHGHGIRQKPRLRLSAHSNFIPHK